VVRFADKNVLVTGAGGGIGGAIVEAFVDEGATVAATDLSMELLAPLVDRHAGRVHPVAADMAVVAEVKNMVAEAILVLRGLDVLVNVAGIALLEPVLDITEQSWQRTLAVNLTGSFFAAQEAARHMVETGGGVIVNIASIDAFVAESPFAHYNASKAGIVMTTKSFAYELGHRGVRCNAVAPGVTWTAMTQGDLRRGDASAAYERLVGRIPLRRPATPSEQAAVVLFLASDDAAFVNGETVIVDGGQLSGYWYQPSLEPPVPKSPFAD